MDGSFFSTMPFSKGEVYSLTSVHYTPHETCFKKLPEFSCQDNSTCSSRQLNNCNNCPNKPLSMHKEMEELFNAYLLDKYKFNYTGSLYTIKPIVRVSMRCVWEAILRVSPEACLLFQSFS